MTEWLSPHTPAQRFKHGFPGGSAVENPPAKQETGSILRSRRYPGEGNGNPLQDFCLENSMDGGAWWATGHGVAKE